MDINQIANILLSTLASLNIPGASFAIQYRRTSGRPIDATSTWKSLADATRYARNIDEVPYVPYNSQIISIEGDDSIYILVNDDTIPKSDGRGHFKLHKISTGEAAEGKYLSKLVEDTAQKLIHFLDGIDVVGPLSACKAKISDEISSVDYAKNVTGWLINKEGLIEANKVTLRELLEVPELTVSKKVTTLDLLVQALADLHDLSVSHVATLMQTVIKDYVSSETFVSGFSGEGMKIYKALDGSWNMEIDNLTVRKIFSVFELVVQKMTHQGGMVIRSAAGAKLTKVTDGGSYWKCEHDSTDDFVKDDQVLCQAFTGKSAKRYWRLVTSAGTGYFNLSKTDCEAGSSSPGPGDDVAVLGNRTNTARQKVQIDCAIGDIAPYRDDYAGINSYSLTDKLITRTGELSGITDAVFGVLSGSGLYGTNVWLKGTFILRSGKRVEEAISDAESRLETRITTIETNFEIREGQISSKVTEVTTAVTNAKKSETAAASSASTATSKAGEASASAANAKKSADDATAKLVTITEKESSINQTAGNITLQVKEVTKKATEASESASAASGSASTAASKAGEAATSATNAKKSADDASAKLVTITEKESSINQTAGSITLQVKEVTTKAGEASAAATNAKKSETSAAGSASTATTKAGEAATSAANAKKLLDDVDGKYVTKTTYDSGIKVLKDSIDLKVNTTTFNALGNRVTAAESAITVAQNAIEQRVTKTEYNKVGRLVAYGTNSDAAATSYVVLNETQLNYSGRGFTLFKINRTTLEFTKVGTYDVYAGGSNYTNFVNALNAIDTNYIIVVISYDAIGIDTATANALAAYGGSGMTCTATRRSYVLIGQKGIGKGNGLEQWKQGTAGNVTISATIINGAVTGFFGGGNTTSALASAETRITQTENSIRLKADQTVVDGINTRLQSAEAKITPDAIKLTVKSQTETIAANAAKRTELWVDATGLDVTKYYPVIIGMGTTIPYIITVQRTLYAGYGKPSWSTHSEGFSVMCRWQSNGSGWGTIAIQRTVLDYAYSFADIVPVGSISQITEASLEYIYVRGGSKYCVIVEGATGVNISLKTSAYTWTSGTTARTLDVKTEVTIPLVDLKQRPTTDTIKSQITLDGFGVSVFGKKIDFTGQVIFNSLNSSLQGTINDKATGAQVTAAQTAANNAQTTANTAKTNAATAQATADAAKSSATSANNLLSDITNDNKLTAAEKQQTKKEWDTIVSEKTKNDAAADRFSVPKTAYGTAYTTLSNYITPLLSSLTTTSAITGTDFRAKFKAYYDARTDLLNAIAAKAKTLADNAQTAANNAQTTADTAKSNATTAQNTANAAKSAATTAQSTADTAKTNAATAQSTANTAKSSAESANSLLTDIASDNKLTPSDKQQAKKEWDAIVSEKVKNDAAADKFGVSKTAYGTAYSNLSTYVTPLLSSLTTTSAIAGTTFRANFKAYYDARTDLLNAISEKARTLAVAAQLTADTAKSNASTAQTMANNVNTALNTLKTSLKGMAYQDMVTLAKLDTTIIEGGHIKTSLIDANAIVTGTLVAGIISTTDITTGRLTATTGAKIGGFKVEGDRLTSADAKGSLMIGDNMVRFLRINEYGTANPSAALLQIRNDKGAGISISGGANKPALAITGNGTSYAIQSYGSHVFGQRDGEKWNAPGALIAGRVSAGGSIENTWGNGVTSISASRNRGDGGYTIYHNLGHNNYYVMITPTCYWDRGYTWAAAMILEKTSSYFQVDIIHTTAGSRNVAFEFVMIGRNKF